MGGFPMKLLAKTDGGTDGRPSDLYYPLVADKNINY